MPVGRKGAAHYWHCIWIDFSVNREDWTLFPVMRSAASRDSAAKVTNWRTAMYPGSLGGFDGNHPIRSCVCLYNLHFIAKNFYGTSTAVVLYKYCTDWRIHRLKGGAGFLWANNKFFSVLSKYLATKLPSNFIHHTISEAFFSNASSLKWLSTGTPSNILGYICACAFSHCLRWRTLRGTGK
jgi:hypothetical protein